MASKMNKFYKYCVVPQCGNTTKTTPNKLFIIVPSKIGIRQQWLRLAGRDPNGFSPDSTIYFCADHFDLPNDMENYIKYHVMGYVGQIRLKPGSVPTRFDCLSDGRKTTCIRKKRQYILENQRNQVREDCINEGSSSHTQLHNTFKSNQTDTDTMYQKQNLDLNCEQSYDFEYQVLKEEIIINDNETYDKNFDKEEDRSVKIEVKKETDGNKEVLSYMSKVDITENEKLASGFSTQNYTFQHESLKNVQNDFDYLENSPGLICLSSEERDYESSFNEEVNIDIKKEMEDESEEEKEVIGYNEVISKIDIHEHEVLASIGNSGDNNFESDTKPLIKGINDIPPGQEVNDGFTNLNTIEGDDDVNIKPIIISDINNTDQEWNDLRNSSKLTNFSYRNAMRYVDTSQAKVNNTNNNAKEDLVLNISENRKPKNRDVKIRKEKKNSTYDTDDPFNEIKQSKAKRFNFKKAKRNSVKTNRVNQKVEMYSSKKKLNKTDQNHDIDLDNIGAERLIIVNNKHEDNSLEYKYSCIICNFKTNIKKWMKCHAILHLDKDVEDILVCDYCDYITKVKFCLISHIKRHMSQFRYTCKICTYKCKYNYNLISHMRTHTEKPLSCDICGYKCAHKRLLNNHLKTHTDKKPFQCDICEYRCSLKQYLVRHIRVHTGERPFSCKICEAKFAWSGDLAKHVRIHFNLKPHSCDICSYKTVDKQSLTKHMRIHSGVKPYTCKYCPYTCRVSGSLRSHMNIHTKNRPYSCKICNYTSKQQSALKTHMRTHTKEKPYKCHLCDYKAAQKIHLDRHIMRHTGEKPFACDICSYKCSRKGVLVDHIKTHTSNRPYRCVFCEYKCSRKSLLVLHVRTHTGEKPYACDLCDFKCARNSSLYSHMKTHTGCRILHVWSLSKKIE